MKLTSLIQSIPCDYKAVGDIEAVEITSVCIDSRKVSSGTLFFCAPGAKTDGHIYAPQAVEKGAAALVVDHELPLNIPQVIVPDVRLTCAYMAAAFYGHPADQMILLGITGTKGKTTTSYMVKTIMEQAGHKVGLIGTVGSMIGSEMIPGTLTTPDSIDLQALLRRMADAGVTCVIMEVSAHALTLHRIAGMTFTVGAFSNFSQDHLDFYGDMEHYFAAKMLFANPELTHHFVYNADCERVERGMKELGREALRVGIAQPSDLYAKEIEIGERCCAFRLVLHKQFDQNVTLNLPGIFNVYNALLAAGICLKAGANAEAIKAGLEAVRSVPGRIELLDTRTPYRVILDYAHSPDALENILEAVRQTTKGSMIALFGCGGNRDSAKRPIMGEIGGNLADYCILTSDNPRYEDPFEILKEIEAGIQKTDCPYIVIENRREAIRYALNKAVAGDVIVLAGKGHETYQEIKGVKHPFDEKIVVAELLEEIVKA